MDRVIDLNKYKNAEQKRVEELGFEKYGIIKAKDDVYLYPEVSYTTGSDELDSFFRVELKMELNDLLEDEVIEQINDIVTNRNQKVCINLLKQEGEMLEFEIFNISNYKRFILATSMEYDMDNRRVLTAIVARAIDYCEVNVMFFIELNYKDVEEMIRCSN